jgi:hypothetical protein
MYRKKNAREIFVYFLYPLGRLFWGQLAAALGRMGQWLRLGVSAEARREGPFNDGGKPVGSDAATFSYSFSGEAAPIYYYI